MRSLSVVLLPVALLSLAGCSAIVDGLHSESESHFDDRATFLDSGLSAAEEAAWLPSDATDITVRESTKSGVTPTAVIGFVSDAEPTGCESTERLSLPSYAVEWGPDGESIVATTSVLSCGDWVLIPTDEGWFGWTPSAPGEHTAT